MKLRLSYSQIRLYSECGMKYKYSYIDRLREKTKSGALLFGTAIDKAMEACLKNQEVNEYKVFDDTFTHQDINKNIVYIPDSTLVVYAASDYDYDLLQPEDIKFLTAKINELLPEYSGEDVDAVFKRCATAKKQKGFRHFRESENKFLNLCNWLSMRRKGHLMLKAHRERVLPNITKVVGTQVKVELDNGHDSLIGYADLVAHWMGEDQPTVFDYKTSSIEYEADSVLTSPQLTIYSHALGVKKAGYIVFRKGILKNKVKTCSQCGMDGTGSRAKSCTNEGSGKRCGGSWDEIIKPEVDIQIITDLIPEQTENIVMENVDAVNKAIHSGVFTRNFSACKQGYGDCPYIKLCFKNSTEDLEQV